MSKPKLIFLILIIFSSLIPVYSVSGNEQENVEPVKEIELFEQYELVLIEVKKTNDESFIDVVVGLWKKSLDEIKVITKYLEQRSYKI